VGNIRLSCILTNDMVLGNWVDERLRIDVRYCMCIWARVDSYCDVDLRLFLKLTLDGSDKHAV